MPFEKSGSIADLAPQTRQWAMEQMGKALVALTMLAAREPEITGAYHEARQKVVEALEQIARY